MHKRTNSDTKTTDNNEQNQYINELRNNFPKLAKKTNVEISKLLNETDPRLKKFSIDLKKSIEDFKNEKTQASDNAVLNLWPSLSTKERLENPVFYEQSITQPVLLTQNQFLNSLKRKNVLPEIINNIALVSIDYKGFDNKIYHGQIVVHKDLEYSIKKIFKRILLETDFPMTSVFPISMFDWNSSSVNNNSGAFDWRFVVNSDEISDHSFGAAIDINPIINPWLRQNKIDSQYYPYNPNKKGTIHSNSDIVKIFKEEWWKWGGDWENSKDLMHFYRPDIPLKYYGKIEVIE